MLNGTCSMERAVEDVKMGSRRYGKRQLSWFRRNQEIHWLIRQGSETQEEIIDLACKILTDFDN